MTDKHLKDLAAELQTSLKNGAVSEADRTVLEQVHTEVQAALSDPAPRPAPVSLREKLQDAIERLEGEHPHITSLLSKSLDALSDLGI